MKPRNTSRRDHDSEGAFGSKPLSMCDAFSHLHDMEAYVFNIMDHLITQVNNIDNPDSRENTFAILEPLNDSALDFITPVVNAWDDTTVMEYFADHLRPPPGTCFDSDRYQSVRWNTQRAREVLPYLDATIVRMEAPLTAQLRKLKDQKSRFLKWPPWSSPSPELVNLLDNLPQTLSALRYSCRQTMQYLDAIEGFVVCLNDFFSDERRAAAFGRRREFVEALHDLADIAAKSQEAARYHPGVLWYYKDRESIHRSRILQGLDASVNRDHKIMLSIFFCVVSIVILIFWALF
ncbi:hypothetical protein EV421DRAFT_2021926 [Armillaria borealis]|uniref:Uncharacterized protein n=1 Tax=Armillaria borealis TaxID=47425 RepID=A0AA39J8C9_9AGAR|nr:hypothetical protein EV421DRAFT_2021926 [Armillaria borealis]